MITKRVDKNHCLFGISVLSQPNLEGAPTATEPATLEKQISVLTRFAVLRIIILGVAMHEEFRYIPPLYHPRSTAPL
jgi:hypothetical protein